jgi:hypothetical protein
MALPYKSLISSLFIFTYFSCVAIPYVILFFDLMLCVIRKPLNENAYCGVTIL